ncbi:MAG TPA: DUF480 domain-containing protein, partial [Ramlibacter sp.]
AHLLCGPVDVASYTAAAAAQEPAPGGLAARVTALEAEVAQLRASLADIASQLGMSPPGQPEANDRA